ncbi:MAG: hypothetical protein GY814_04135 [Gammaproteobacteria bacterium]|nr:hypothetical protein [Gammaproteobacteria bacterium]
MKLVYRPLLEIQLRHSFYMSGIAVDDFKIVPSASTLEMLKQYDLIMRKNDTGFVIYAEVDASSVGEAIENVSPVPLPRLKNEHLEETLHLSFYLQANNKYLSNITELKRYDPGRELFYFNNLRDDQDSGLLRLGDSFTDQRVGDAIALVSAETVTYRFNSAVNSATIQINDSFGNTLHNSSFQLDDLSITTLEHRIDLNDVSAMRAGRYSLIHEGSVDGPQVFYFDPDIFALNALAVIEIFDSTVGLTADESELVAAEYQFLLNNEIQAIGTYALQLEARATTWRYNVIKKYDSNPYSLVNLDDITDFTKSLESKRAIFLADDERALSEQPAAIVLNHSGTKLRNLPSPQLTTQLQQGASEDSYISDMYIYV